MHCIFEIYCNHVCVCFSQVYVVARAGRLTFFKDQKAVKAVPELTFRNEPPLLLENASAEVASDYTKKKHVLRIK